MNMIHEKSCGAIVWQMIQGKPLYLLIRQKQGHICFPKGHIEAGESETECAAREILEETGIEVVFTDGFRECTSYSPYRGCIKEVVWFLAEYTGGREKIQAEEVTDIYHVTYEEAMGMLTYNADAELLEKADAFLHRKG